MSKLIAVDLGSHRVKLAVYEGGFGRYQLEQVLGARVDQDEVEAPTPGARLAALTELLRQLPSGGRPAYAAAWPAEQASLRHVVLPFGDKAQVEKVLPFEVEGMVPFDLEDVELRHRLLHQEGGESHVLVAMVEREPLVGWLSALHATGADPRTVDIDADVLGELSREGAQAVIDLGHTRTLVSLCQDGQVVAARALDGGGRQLTLALAQALGLTWAEAEDRKHVATISLGAPGPSSPVQVEWEGEETTSPGQAAGTPPRPLAADADGAVLGQALVPLLAELRSTLIGFEDGMGVEIDEVLLVGGGSHLGGLRDLLANTLGVPVRLADPGTGPTAQTDPGSWALVHSIGARACRGKPAALDLRHGALAFKGDLYVLRQVGIYGGVFAACALLAGTGMFVVRAVQLERQLSALDAEIAQAVADTFPGEIDPEKVDSASKALAIMTEKSLEVTTRVDTLGSILTDEPPTVTLLRDLSQAMPAHGEARVDVDELSMNSSTITLKAETDGYEAAARIESSLQASERFKGARKGDEKKARGGGISFTVTIPREVEASSTGEEG